MKILVAVDKSAESQQALRYICHLLEHFEADVDALYVKPNLVDSVAESFLCPLHDPGGCGKVHRIRGGKNRGGNFRGLRDLPGG